MKRMIILAVFIGVLLLTIVSAQVQTIGPVKQNTCVNLIQTCSNCTYNNISVINYPDNTIHSVEKSMTKVGTSYNYTFCSTTILGRYIINGYGNPDGLLTNWQYDTSVTPSGSTGILGLTIIIILVIYGIAFIGFFGKNVWVAMLGGLGMIILGLYLINNGVDVYRNLMTDALSWVTIGLGAIFTLTSGAEMINDNM